MRLFKRKISQENEENLFVKRLMIALKTIILLGIPVIPAGAAAMLWYFLSVMHGWHFPHEVENIITTEHGSIVAILYGFIVIKALDTVSSKYTKIRMAVKKYDFDTFADLRDEELSILWYILGAVFGSILLMGISSLEYPPGSPWSGKLIVGSISYCMMLIFLIIWEIDHPCSGLWFIQNIPEQWLKVNVKRYRKMRCAVLHEVFCRNMHKWQLRDITPFPSEEQMSLWPSGI